jgi:hypothetical protein
LSELKEAVVSPERLVYNEEAFASGNCHKSGFDEFQVVEERAHLVNVSSSLKISFVLIA